MSTSNQDLRERVASLERSRRRWRATAVASIAAWAVLLAVAAFTTAAQVAAARSAMGRELEARMVAEEAAAQARVERVRAIAAEEEARRQAEENLKRAQDALREAERARQNEKEAKEQVQRFLYQSHISQAYRQLEKDKAAAGRLQR